MNKKAFTLVELIVVITILAVLWTIWFLSFLWYTESSRDSARLSDITSMKKVIDIYEVDNWFFPSNTNPVDVTYWGDMVFTQWVFWDRTISDLLWLINEAPLDPLAKTKYSYSLTSDKKEYQISGLLEWSDFAMFNWNQAHAWTTPARSMVRGNYNGQILKKQTWSDILLLAVPSITINNETVTDLDDIASQNRFVYETNWNLSSELVDSDFNSYWSPSKIIVNQSFIELYNWLLSWLNDDTNLLSAFTNLQDAYNWTSLEWDYRISKSLSYDISWDEANSLKYIRWMLNNNVSKAIKLAE